MTIRAAASTKKAAGRHRRTIGIFTMDLKWGLKVARSP